MAGYGTPSTPNLPMKASEVRDWWRRVELARHRRKREAEKWKAYLKNYLPPPTDQAYAVNSNIHFRNVELKKAELFAQLPELILTPQEPLHSLIDPQTGQPFAGPDGQPMDPSALAAHITAIKRAVLTKLLGRDHANVGATIDRVLFDIFATSGIGATKICYEVDTQPTEIEVPGAPVPMEGSVLGLQTMPGPPTTEVVPVPVCERWRWYHFSAAKLLIPHDYHSTEFDEAPWLGMEFVLPKAVAVRLGYVPKEFTANATRDDLILDPEKDSGEGTADLVKGVEIWLHTAQYDPTVANSQLFRCLVLIEGQTEKPAQYRDSPYQTVGPDGRLTADSMIGNPIHPFVLRVLSDSAYVPSDAAFMDPLVRIENTWMGQDVKMRDANIPRFMHADSITDAVDKLRNADAGQGVGVPDEVLARGADKVLAQVPHLEQAQSDVAGRALLRRAMDETLGIGANQAGGFTATVRSATESAIVNQNVSVRLKKEQNALLERILAGVRKFDALVQRYADQREYVEVVGPDGAKTLAMWDQRVISGRYAYDAHPDSQLTLDAAQRRAEAKDFVNFMAKSPYLNQAELARMMALVYGYDPARMVQQPQPSGPPPPTVSFAFKGADLAIPEVRAILGVTMPQIPLDGPPSPEAALALQAQEAKGQPHGGGADLADKISQHHSDQTGAMPGRVPAGAPPAVETPGRVN